jgi:hypothetical protein
MSEQELLARIRGLPVTATATATPPVVRARETRAVERAERDLLREVAYTRGIDVYDIQPCYYSRAAYDWCLALLGLTDRPPHPFPPELSELLLKLVGTGKVEASQLRRLGLEWTLVEVVSGRVESTLRGIVSGTITPAEAENRLMRLSQIVRATSRVVEPAALERKIVETARRAVGSEEAARALISFIRGELSPPRAVEEIVSAVSSRRPVTPVQKTERMEVARAVAPREEIETRKAVIKGG